MDKIELKEMDREILRLWEGGVLLDKIELGHPKARSRVQAYKNRGIVGEGRAVDWAKFEAVDPPQMRAGIAGDKAADNTEGIAGDNTKAIPGIVSDNTPTIPRGNTRTIPGIALSPEDAEALRELVSWWRTRKEDGGVQGGKRKAVTFKLAEGLLEALKSAAEQEGLSQAEILSRALRAYLGGAGGQ